MIWAVLGYLAAWSAGGLVLLFMVGALLGKTPTILRRLRKFWRAILVLVCGPLAILALMWGCYETEGSVMPFVRLFLKSLLSPISFVFFAPKEVKSEDDTTRDDCEEERTSTQTRSGLINPIMPANTDPVPRARNIKVEIPVTSKGSWFNFKK